MNTNDEQAGYGGRAPMVSDKEVSAMQEHHDFMFSGHQVMPANAHHYGLLDMRKAYEKLITTGKLRVVGEVVWTTDQYGREVCLNCHNNNAIAIKEKRPQDVIALQWTLKSNGLKFCPGCGNTIKQ